MAANKPRDEAKKHLHRRPTKRSQLERQEIQALKEIIEKEAPSSGTNPLSLDPKLDHSYSAARQFKDLPLSQKTKDGLRKANYTTLTAIQRAALPHALCGRDILGAAKTGSGKTLAFLIPVLETLFRAQWTTKDGLGALVLTPTRELALQIFEELRKIGPLHELSAGLLIGGHNVKEEKDRVLSLNILICTPGRLLQHMDETPGFDASNLQILVLDEADRILDMGFATSVDAILENVPRERQTLLFSATQTKSVRDLARLSLSSPEYLAVHADASAPTPLKLTQAYMVVPPAEKLDMLWSFIKTHLSSKTLVFLSTCKQVRFVYEAFKKLRPGIPLRSLHGNMTQGKRAGVFREFSDAKAAVLFATDVASRGLDFPAVDWVVQADCPEDVAAYIHRVGRTARYTSAGRALLFVSPSEAPGMLEALQAANVPVNRIKANPHKTMPVTPSLQALLSKDLQLKEFAQRALVSYLRSVFLQPNKAIFDVTTLPAEELSASMGLLTAPKLRFLKRIKRAGNKDDPAGDSDGGNGSESMDEELPDQSKVKHTSNQGGKARREEEEEGGEEEEEETSEEEEEEGRKGGRKRKRDLGAGARSAENGSDADWAEVTAAAGGDGGVQGEEDEDFMVIKKRDVFDMSAELPVAPGVVGAEGSKKKKKKKLKIKEGQASGKRVVFSEDGEMLDPLALLATRELGNKDGGHDGEGDDEGLYVVDDAPQKRWALAAQLLKKRDIQDKASLKALRKEQRTAVKARAKASAAEENEPQAVLGGRSDESEDDGGEAESSHDESTDGDDEEEFKGPPPPRRAEIAHAGMARKADLPLAVALGGKKQVGVSAMSTADQESLALKMIRSRT